MPPLTSTGARILFVRIPRGRVFTSNQFVLPKDQTAVPCKLAMRLALPQRTFSDQDMVPKNSVFWWRYELAAHNQAAVDRLVTFHSKPAPEQPSATRTATGSERVKESESPVVQ